MHAFDRQLSGVGEAGVPIDYPAWLSPPFRYQEAGPLSRSEVAYSFRRRRCALFVSTRCGAWDLQQPLALAELAGEGPARQNAVTQGRHKLKQDPEEEFLEC